MKVQAERGMFVTVVSRLSLREISADTVREICDLAVSAAQEEFVASNAESIAEAYFCKEAWFRAIYCGDRPVGFVMLHLEPEDGEYFLWRFMIAEDEQGKGYGTEAMRLILEHVRTLPNATTLKLSCVPGEGSPEEFYGRFGFTFTGEIEDGEKIYSYDL